jgi:hypothetical protein
MLWCPVENRVLHAAEAAHKSVVTCTWPHDVCTEDGVGVRSGPDMNACSAKATPQR